jgi:hypothetical protein
MSIGRPLATGGERTSSQVFREVWSFAMLATFVVSCSPDLMGQAVRVDLPVFSPVPRVASGDLYQVTPPCEEVSLKQDTGNSTFYRREHLATPSKEGL